MISYVKPIFSLEKITSFPWVTFFIILIKFDYFIYYINNIASIITLYYILKNIFKYVYVFCLSGVKKSNSFFLKKWIKSKKCELQSVTNDSPQIFGLIDLYLYNTCWVKLYFLSKHLSSLNNYENHSHGVHMW